MPGESDPVVTAAPVRLQRSRAKGSRLVSPNGLPIVCVTRPGRWGNPYETASDFRDAMALAALRSVYRPSLPDRDAARRNHMGRIVARLDALRGKNLACWCKPGESCHADVLLELANAPTRVPTITEVPRG